MNNYEHTVIIRNDASKKQIQDSAQKYEGIITKNSGKIVKIEKWGSLNLANTINKNRKGFYIHYKFEGNKKTLNEIDKKIKIDSSIIRHLLVKYKKLDTKNEYFKKEK